MMIRLMAPLVALILTAAPVLAAPIQIFLAHAQRQDADSDTAAAVADEFRRQVDALSDGRLKVEILSDGIMGGNRDTTALVEKGVIHSALVTLGGVTPVYPPLSVIQLPFAFDSLDAAHRVLGGAFGRSLAEGMAAKTRLRLLGFADPAGFHILTNLDRVIRDPDEMWGLRIRAIPGSKPLEAMIRSVGAVPVKVSSHEELSALSTKAIDGQMNPAAVVLARGFDNVQHHATLTNHLYAPYVWIFNGTALDALPAADADVIVTASQAALAKGHAMAVALNQSDRGLVGLKKRLEVHELTASERAAFKTIMQPPVAEAIVTEIGTDGEDWMKAFNAAIGTASK